ncbi:MAG: TusE/DsrC/DsvC family sulfur relay protein [Propionibacteriaceae bacterium]|jgi:sulfide:quinone oxidoreductase|nr:TusE/DsrC/DsvC family sulfur relay protein [Propionibacteriaceae bacterium]
MKRLVILGGGTAGSIAANKLRAQLSASQLAITVVDRDDSHHYQPGYLFLPFGGYRAKQLVRSRQAQLRPGVAFVEADIDRVDADAAKVLLADGRELPYDYLIIATGVAPRPDLTPGMTGPGWGTSIHEFYTLDGARKLAEAIRLFRGGRVVVHLTDMPIKCPVAPLEFALLMDAWLTDHGIRERTELTYATVLDAAFTKPVASATLGSLFDERHINLETDFTVERVDGEAKQIISYDGRALPFDLLVTVPLNLGAEYVARSGLGDDLNLVPCDQHTMKAIGHDAIWVLGDAGTLATSKAGSVAHFSIDIFVDNFVAEFRGGSASHSFDGHSNCFVESGHGKAMLLDFNYDTQPYAGTFPLPAVGPFSLLKQTSINHLGKLAFRHLYWGFLIPGRPIPLPSAMSKLGKRIVPDPVPRPAAPRQRYTATLDVPTSGPRPAAPSGFTPPVTGPTTRVAGRDVKVDAEGFMTDYGQWDDAVGAGLAELVGQELTDEHWQAIRFLREDFPARGETATLRRASMGSGIDVKRLFELFPSKPAKKMAYIAGLPKPKGCV